MTNAAKQIKEVAAWKKHLLPRAMPQLDGWEWAVHSWADDWPGGDYFDVLPLNSEQWLVFLGDASGHGGGAAVMVGMTRMVLHSCPLSSGQERLPFCPVHGLAQSPSIILSRLNQVLEENTLDEQFMTAFLGVWKPAQARMDFVVAGQELPRCWRQASQQVETLPVRAGLPLGVSPVEAYGVSHVTLARGDALVIFTDGLVEARNPRGKMFGVGQVEKAIQACGADGADAIKAGLLGTLAEFLHGNPPKDDITFLVLKRWD